MSARAAAAEVREALIEDVEWMAATGETLPGAAARLHIHPGQLRATLDHYRRKDLVGRLLANHGSTPPLGRVVRGAA